MNSQVWVWVGLNAVVFFSMSDSCWEKSLELPVSRNIRMIQPLSSFICMSLGLKGFTRVLIVFWFYSNLPSLIFLPFYLHFIDLKGTRCQSTNFNCMLGEIILSLSRFSLGFIMFFYRYSGLNWVFLRSTGLQWVQLAVFWFQHVLNGAQCSAWH